MRKRSLVLVEWIDSHSGNGWRRTEDLATEAVTPMLCRSVGWIVAKTKDTVVLVATISGGHDQYREHGCCDIAIPRGSIVRTTKLRP